MKNWHPLVLGPLFAWRCKESRQYKQHNMKSEVGELKQKLKKPTTFQSRRNRHALSERGFIETGLLRGSGKLDCESQEVIDYWHPKYSRFSYHRQHPRSNMFDFEVLIGEWPGVNAGETSSISLQNIKWCKFNSNIMFEWQYVHIISRQQYIEKRIVSHSQNLLLGPWNPWWPCQQRGQSASCSMFCTSLPCQMCTYFCYLWNVAFLYPIGTPSFRYSPVQNCLSIKGLNKFTDTIYTCIHC